MRVRGALPLPLALATALVLALAAVPPDVPEPVRAHGLAEQVTNTRSKLPLMILPPGVDGFRLRPRKVFIRVHIDIFSLRVLAGVRTHLLKSPLI